MSYISSMKKNDDYVLVIRIKNWIIDKLRKLAKDDKRKMSDYIRKTLEEHVEENE